MPRRLHLSSPVHPPCERSIRCEDSAAAPHEMITLEPHHSSCADRRRYLNVNSESSRHYRRQLRQASFLAPSRDPQASPTSCLFFHSRLCARTHVPCLTGTSALTSLVASPESSLSVLGQLNVPSTPRALDPSIVDHKTLQDLFLTHTVSISETLVSECREPAGVQCTWQRRVNRQSLVVECGSNICYFSLCSFFEKETKKKIVRFLS